MQINLPNEILGRSVTSFILCLAAAVGVYLIAGHGGHYQDGVSIGIAVLSFVIPFALCAK